jgi:hypothetical protein
MNAEQIRIWEETVGSYFKVLSWHSPGETEEIQRNKYVNIAFLGYKGQHLEQFLYTNLLGGLCHQEAACGLKAICSFMLHEHPPTF